MESSLVNARVPLAKKEAASNILDNLGASTSELINGAFDYLLEHKEIPGSKKQSVGSAETFAHFVSATTFDIDWGPHPELVNYKEIISQGKLADYESLT